MARYSISGRSTVTPTATVPGVSLYGTAAIAPRIREIGVFNTTVNAVCLAVVRLTTATNVGAGLTEAKVGDTDVAAAVATGFAGHTGAAGVGDELLRADLGAAIGAGMVWTFDDVPLRVPAATTAGVGVLCPTGTGQVFDYYLIWEE